MLSAEPPPLAAPSARPLPAPPPAPCPVPPRTSASGPEGCTGIVGDTPAGPAMPGVTVALPFFRPDRPDSPCPDGPPVASAAPNSPSAARAWEIRIASMVRSCRISARLQARSASSHIVVRWTGLVPVTSASATTAPFGARSQPPR
ncbi:hypothetical protein ACQ4WX_29770 [Streptomyces lasalocidi]